MPHAAAGMRIDPPVSVPTVPSDMPVATATAEPPLDPPGRSRRIVRIAHRPEARILAGRAERELVQVGLADEHRAGLAQASRHDGIGVGDVIAAHQRSRGGRHALLIDQVLQRDRDAVQRADAASGRRSPCRPAAPAAALRRR